MINTHKKICFLKKQIVLIKLKNVKVFRFRRFLHLFVSYYVRVKG